MAPREHARVMVNHCSKCLHGGSYNAFSYEPLGEELEKKSVSIFINQHSKFYDNNKEGLEQRSNLPLSDIVQMVLGQDDLTILA